jgi:predicted Zn-dependent peptidase
MYPKLYNYTLSNNFKTLLIPINNINNIAISLTFDLGFFDELVGETGYSHFLEHLINRHLTNNTILATLKDKGIYFYSNASTNNFRTSYYLYSNNNNLTILIDALFEIFDIEYIDPKYFKKEMGAVIVEMKQILSKSEKLVFFKQIPEMMFGSKSKLVEDPLQHINTISESTICDLFNFLKKSYTKQNSILTIAGNFNKTKILNYIKSKNIDKSIKLNSKSIKLNSKSIKLNSKSIKLNSKSKLFNKRIINIPKITKPQYVFVKVDINKISNIYLNFFCPNIYNNKKIGILNLLKVILSDLNDSSILFKRLRTKLGIAYSPKISLDLNQYYGIFILKYNIENHNFKKSFEEIIDILNDLKNKLIMEDLLILAKNRNLYKIEKNINNKNPEEYLTYSNNILNNDFPLYNDKQFYEKFIQNVTLHDIRQLSKEIFKKNNAYLCAIGTHKYDSKIIYKNLNKLS